MGGGWRGGGRCLCIYLIQFKHYQNENLLTVKIVWKNPTLNGKPPSVTPIVLLCTGGRQRDETQTHHAPMERFINRMWHQNAEYQVYKCTSRLVSRRSSKDKSNIHVAIDDKSKINPYLPSGPVHPYQMDESFSNFRGVYCTFSVLFYLNRYSAFCGIRSGSALFT